MSFGFSIGDFVTVLALANQVRQKWIDAPQEYASLVNETRNISNILRDITDLEGRVTVTPEQAENFRDVAVTCTSVLKSLQNIAEKYSTLDKDTNTSRRSLRRFWQRLKLDPDDIRQVRAQLTSAISALNAVYASVLSTWTFEVKETINEVKKNDDERLRDQVADWYAPGSYADQQSDYYSQHHPGTCDWFLNDPVFLKWCSSSNPKDATLLCPGIPGSGKTILAATIVNHLQESFENLSDTVVVYHYFNFKRSDEQRLPYVLSSFIRQLFLEADASSDVAQRQYQKHKRRGTRPSLEELKTTFSSLLETYRKVYIVVDALDEARTTEYPQDKLLKELTSLQSTTTVDLKLIATTRNIGEILDPLPDIPRLNISAHSGDIEAYLDARMLELATSVQRNVKLQTDIKTTLTRLADGMFLLARLHFDSLRGETTPKAIRKALETLPHGSQALFVAYDSARERIDHQLKGLRELAHQVLMWITYAKKQLSIAQLQEAIAIEPGMSEIDREDDFVDEREILSVCAGLVVVDAESNVIRLVHYTTQEYLEHVRDDWFKDAQKVIATKCVAYLMMDVFGRRKDAEHAIRDEVFDNFNLLEYAGHHWGYHAGAVMDSQFVEDLTMLLHKESENYRTAAHLLYASQDPYLRRRENFFDHVPILHLATTFNFFDLVRKLVEAGEDIEQTDSRGNSLLAIAAKSGRKDIIEYLLAQPNIDLNRVNGSQHTPLLLATRFDRLETLKILLRQPTLNVNAIVCISWSALLAAVSSGKVEATRCLLAHPDIDLNLADQWGWTALARAADSNKTEIFHLLLAHPRTNINSRDNQGQTPIFRAIRNQKLEFVEAFLNHPDIDLTAKSSSGSTPLTTAAITGNSKIVRLLWSRRNQPQQEDKIPEEHRSVVPKVLTKSYTD